MERGLEEGHDSRQGRSNGDLKERRSPEDERGGGYLIVQVVPFYGAKMFLMTGG